MASLAVVFDFALPKKRFIVLVNLKRKEEVSFPRGCEKRKRKKKYTYLRHVRWRPAGRKIGQKVKFSKVYPFGPMFLQFWPILLVADISFWRHSL
jgi:hypothetical protein